MLPLFIARSLHKSCKQVLLATGSCIFSLAEAAGADTGHRRPFSFGKYSSPLQGRILVEIVWFRSTPNLFGASTCVAPALSMRIRPVSRRRADRQIRYPRGHYRRLAMPMHHYNARMLCFDLVALPVADRFAECSRAGYRQNHSARRHARAPRYPECQIRQISRGTVRLRGEVPAN